MRAGEYIRSLQSPVFTGAIQISILLSLLTYASSDRVEKLVLVLFVSPSAHLVPGPNGIGLSLCPFVCQSVRPSGRQSQWYRSISVRPSVSPSVRLVASPNGIGLSLSVRLSVRLFVRLVVGSCGRLQFYLLTQSLYTLTHVYIISRIYITREQSHRGAIHHSSTEPIQSDLYFWRRRRYKSLSNLTVSLCRLTRVAKEIEMKTNDLRYNCE